MSDVVHASPAKDVIRPFNVVSAHVGRLGADGVLGQRRPVRGPTQRHLVETAVGHVQGEFHVIVDGIIYGLDTIGVMDSKFGIVRSLYRLVDDTVDYLPLVSHSRPKAPPGELRTPSVFMFNCTP